MITKKHTILSNGLFPPNDETYIAICKAMDEYTEARVLDFMQTVHGWGFMEKMVNYRRLAEARWRLYENHSMDTWTEYTTSELYQRYLDEKKDTKSI